MTQNAAFAASLLDKLGIPVAEARKAVDMLADSELGKATTQHAEGLAGANMVPDRWQAGHMHKVPSADTLKVGPTEHASGGGAEQMIGDYSNPAPQRGIQMEAERLAGELGQMRGYMKSLTDAHNGLVDLFKGNSDQVSRLTMVMAAMLAKADDDEEEEEESEVVEIHANKAKALFAKAQRLLEKAKKAKAKAKDEEKEDEKACKALKDQARFLRSAALKCLAKARVYTVMVKKSKQAVAVDICKALNDFIDANPRIKSDINVVQEEEEEEEDEKKAKKAKAEAKAAKKASLEAKAQAVASTASGDAAKAVQGHSDAKGNQSDRQDGATGNQDDSSVKAQAQIAEIAGKVDNALSGLGLLKTDIAGLFDAISGKPATQPVDNSGTLSLMKSDQVTVTNAIATRIEKAIEDEQLDVAAEHRARDLLMKYEGVRSGLMTEDVFQSQLRNAPYTVQQLFQLAA